MLQEQITFYIRGNAVTIIIVAGGILLCVLLVILIQVTRTKKEVHNICRKVQKYLEVVLSEENRDEVSEKIDEASNNRMLAYQKAEDIHKQQGESGAEEDARLIMDIIQEVF